jgi:uncharacterized OB-fold protein
VTSAERSFPDVEPLVEPGIEPYWEAAAEGRLVLSRCAEDGAALWPPRPFCPRHASAGVRWEPAGGGAEVYSYTVVHRGEGAFAAVAPYVLAYVQLDEGPRVLTNLVTSDGTPATEAHIGQRVVARFEQGKIPVLRFAQIPQGGPRG